MNKKINILFTIPNFKTAGSQFVLLAIYNNLDRNLFNPSILVEKHPDIFPETIPKEEQFFLPLKGDVIPRINRLAKFLVKHKIAILHSWDYKSVSLEAIACKRAGVKYMYTKKNNAWSKRWFIKSFCSNHIVYNNPDMKNRFFTSNWLKNKVTFIPHGVDTNFFRPNEKKEVSNNFVIGCIGVIGNNKNQLFILNALLNLPENILVEFYGKADGDYLSKLKTFIELNNLQNRVAFKGFVENKDIPSVMKRFDVLALASKNEGLPLCLIEAMACGVPVLSSDSGGGARYIVGDNEGGYIYVNQEDFVSRILQLRENLVFKEELSKKGVERVKSHFSLEKEVDAYQELYLKL